MNPLLKQILIIAMCAILFGSLFFPMMKVSVSSTIRNSEVYPASSSFTSLHSYSGYDCVKNNKLGFSLLICPILLILFFRIPLFRKKRDLLTCSLAAIGLLSFVAIYLIYADERTYALTQPINHVTSFVDIGSILILVTYMSCIIIALFPDRTSETAQKQKKSKVCPTCGTTLWQDGKCPACYERMALLDQLQETDPQ